MNNFSQLNLHLIEYDNDDSLEIILANLIDFACEYDDDFSGENGEECLWDIAKENGCFNNAEYTETILHKAIEEEDIIGLNDLIDRFLDQWLGTDCYYVDYTYKIDYNVIAICFMYK